MALSEYKHHSSRGQRKDRATEEGHRDKYEAPRRQNPPPPQRSRPPCLGEPRVPQARVQKHTMEQLADVVPMVQILDCPCAADGGTGARGLQAPGRADGCRAGNRSAHYLYGPYPAVFGRAPSPADGGTVDGSADYFLSCPTPAADCRAARFHSSSSHSWWSSSSWFSPAEKGSTAFFPQQIVDVPGHSGGPQGFHSRQGSTASFPVQTVNIPSSDGGFPEFSTAPASQIAHIPSSGGPHGFLPRQGSAASAAENVEFLAGGGLHGLRPGLDFPAFSEPEHGHDAPRRSRRGGGSVSGPQGSVPGQSTTARGRARHRQFVGRLFILPEPEGCGFIESSAEAESGRAAFGGFRVPISWQEALRRRLVRDVLYGRVQTASWRPTTSRRWVGSEGLVIPSPHLGCHHWQSCSVSTCCPRRAVLDSSGLCFRIVRFAWFHSGYSSCVSLRWLLVVFSHIFVRRWTSDPEVDSQTDLRISYEPFVFGSHWFDDMARCTGNSGLTGR